MPLARCRFPGLLIEWSLLSPLLLDWLPMPIGGFPLRAFVEPKKNRDFKSETQSQVPQKGSEFPQVISLMRQVVLVFYSTRSCWRANKKGLPTGIDGAWPGGNHKQRLLDWKSISSMQSQFRRIFRFTQIMYSSIIIIITCHKTSKTLHLVNFWPEPTSPRLVLSSPIFFIIICACPLPWPWQ